MNTEKSKVISAAQMALLNDVGNLTNDRVEALAGGHGMVNIALHSVANIITDELLRGGSVSIEFADARRTSISDILEKAIKAAKSSGADGANAALLVACMMYLAGSAAQVGIPAGNRKLGASCRMLAGVDRCGVSAIPTAKMNNKISGFPAVAAVNTAMMNGELCSINGRNIPENVAGGPLYGHSALGEDYIWPEMAENGARIGTQAMLDAMAGAAMAPHPFTAAILGSAAILEIIHPDAEVPEGQGTYGRTSSVYLVGKSAVKTAGLAEKLHMKVTGEEYETAKVIGDVGLILKDIGGPSVIGMMALEEIFACFEEGLSGFSGGPVNAPLGHIGGFAVVAMKALLDSKGDMDSVAEKIVESKKNLSLDAESALVSINIIGKKAAGFWNGPVTKVLIQATEPALAEAIYSRADITFEQISAGKSISEIVEEFDKERQKTVETSANKLFSGMLNKNVKVEILKIKSAARRTGKLIEKYWSFDPLVDISVTADDDVAEMKNFVHEVIPDVSRGKREDVAWAVPLAAAVMDELALAGCTILNVVVPVAVASAMGAASVEELATSAEKAAYISVGIPGGKKAAKNVGNLACSIMNYKS